MKKTKVGFRVEITPDIEAVSFNQAEWHVTDNPCFLRHKPTSLTFRIIMRAHVDLNKPPLSMYDFGAVVSHICAGKTVDKSVAALLGHAAVVLFLFRVNGMAGVIIRAMPPDDIPF